MLGARGGGPIRVRTIPTDGSAPVLAMPLVLGGPDIPIDPVGPTV